MIKKYLSAFMCLLIAGILSCSKNDDVNEINLSNKIQEKTVQPSGESPVRIAIGGMITPRAGFVYYKQLLNYVGEKLGRTVEFVDREDYAEINNMLLKKGIDVAFVSSGPYVDGFDRVRT